MKHQNEREKLQFDFEISHWWWPFYIFLSKQRKPKNVFNCLTTRSFNAGALKVQDFTPTELENVLDSYFHWTTEHTWWTNISSLLSSLRRKAKQTTIRSFVWENWKMQISPVSPSRVKTKTSLCSRHQRAKLNTYFKHSLTGTN